MSPSVSITRRLRRSGIRYVVRYRLGGAETQPIHAGSFKTRRDAETRARWISGELAAMRVPDLHLTDHHPTRLTVPDACQRWLDGRHDLTPASRDNYRPSLARIRGEWGDTPVDDVTPGMVSTWIGGMIDAAIGRTVIDRAMAMLRGTLDDHRDPNPARHRTVRLPKAPRVEAHPPTTAHWEIIRDTVTPRMRPPLVVLEATGLRVGELIALTWGDVDFTTGRLFVRSGKTSAARRWVPVPAHALRAIEEQKPPEDRDPEARVFPGLLSGSLRMALRRVSRHAGIPLYSPHDLRHRYISLAIRRGVDVAAVAAAVGHTRKSMTLDTYTHLLLED